MTTIYYIFKLLSFKKNHFRYAFFLPWFAIILGTIMLLLVDGIMGGMEKEIFKSLNLLDNGYKISNIANDEMPSYINYFKKNNINFEIQSHRDIIISNDGNYIIADMILRNNKESSNPSINHLTIGEGISNQLNLYKNDSALVVFPLDINIATMLIPHKIFLIDSVFSTPVVDFDQLHIFSDISSLEKNIYSEKYLLINQELSKNQLKQLRKNFTEINLSYWKDNYAELISAIKLEKIMYSIFAYFLILIACLGNFTISNFIINNKVKSISMLNVLGFNYNRIKGNIFLIMLLLTILSTIFASLAYYMIVNLELANPLINMLFPENLFYDFIIEFNIFYVLIIIFINITSISFSSLFSMKLIGRLNSSQLLRRV